MSPAGALPLPAAGADCGIVRIRTILRPVGPYNRAGECLGAINRPPMGRKNGGSLMSKLNSRISRRRFVAGAGAVGLGVLAAPRIVRAQDRKITVLNWQGYGTDEKWALEAFKKATGIEVV